MRGVTDPDRPAREGFRRRTALRALALFLALAGTALLVDHVLRGRGPLGDGVPAGRSAQETAATPLDPAALLAETAEDPDRDAPDLTEGRASLEERDHVRLAGDGHIEGVVLDRDGAAPVEAVAVELLPLPPSSTLFFSRMLDLFRAGSGVERRTEAVAVTHSDPAGSFRFEGVRRGNWFVGVSDEHWILDRASRARLTAGGAAVPLEIWVRGGGRILGRVVGADGRAASDARIVLAPGPGLFLRSMERGELAAHETNSDAEGRFAFPAVAPGEGWELSAIATGFAVSHASGLSIEAGRDTDVVLELRPGALVEGRILSAPAESGAEPLPLAGATVSVLPRGLRHLRLAKEILLSSYAKTDAAGRYVLRGVPAGTVDIVAMAPEHVPAKGPAVRASDGTSSEAADFVLERGPLLHGRVRDSAGAPIAGAGVRWMLFDVSGMGDGLSFAPLLAQAMAEFDFPRTDAEGRFVAGPFPGAPDHHLWIETQGFQEKEVAWNPERDGLEIEIVLDRGGSLEGIVMDLAEAKPVPSFTIETASRIDIEPGAPGHRNPFTGGTPVEDPAGRFRLDALAPGKVELLVRAEGYVDAKVEGVEVREGEVTRGLIVKLSPGARVRGFVLDAESHPIAGAFVLSDRSLASAPARSMSSSTPVEQGFSRMLLGVARFAAELGLAGDGVRATARDGSFELVGLEAGTHRILAFHRDWCASESAPLDLVAGEVREGVLLQLSRGGGVQGHVSDRFGRPVADAMVVAFAPGGPGSAGGQRLHEGRSNTEGDYLIEPMEPGGYVLLLTRGDDALDPASFFASMNLGMVSVPAQGRVRYDILDSSAGACRVFGLVTAANEPVAGGNVTAFALDSDTLLGVDLKVARLDQDGAYEFAGLPPGEHRFQIDGGGRSARIWAEIPDVPEYRLDLRLPEGAVGGRIVDAQSHAPVAGATLSLAARRGPAASGLFARMLERSGDSWAAKSDADGRFRFSRLSEGRYELWAEGPAGAASWQASSPLPVDLVADEVLEDLELALEPAPRMIGVVHDEAGIALEGVQLLARHGSRVELTPTRATTDANGRFEIACVAAGAHVLTATADGFAPRSIEALAPLEGKGEELELVLERGVLVSVVVIGADGRAVEGAVASLTREGAAPDESENDVGRLMEGFFGSNGSGSDGKGRLELGRYVPGRYTLDVRRGFATHVQQTIELPSGETEVELRVHLD
jgi:hypothetical protein